MYDIMQDVYIHHVNGTVFLNNKDSPDCIACLQKNGMFESDFKGFTEEEIQDGVEQEWLHESLESWCDAMGGVATNIENALKVAGHTTMIAENGDLSDESYGTDDTEQERGMSWDLVDYTLKVKTATMMALGNDRPE